MANLIDTIRTVITPDVVRDTSSLTGESDAATRNAIEVAVPSILAGVAEVGSTQAGAQRLIHMISDGGYGAETVSGFGHLLADSHSRESLERSGGHLLSRLFGSGTDEVAQAVAEASSISKGAARQVLSLAAPLVIGVLGRQISSLRLDSTGLMNMLMAERGAILSALPPGVARAIGIGEVREEARPLERAETRTIHVVRRSRFRPAVLAALAILTLMFFLTRNRERDELRVDVPPAAEMEGPGPVPQPMPRELPAAGFAEIDTYMSGPASQPTRVFVLEGVTFESGSARLTDEAKAKLKELARILKEHPETRVRLEGHTNDQGGAAANRRLSLDRANSVKAELTSSGVSASSIDVKGRGAERPTGPEMSANEHERIVLVVVKR